MKLKKMIAAIVVGVMAWMTVGTAMALVKEGVVSPMYAHTRRVETALVISESGYAECRGYVRSNKSDDSITMTLTLYQKAGKCQELNYWDMNTQFCGVCGSPMKMSTDISKKCTECGKSVWPSLATAIIVLIKKGDQVLLVHARNFKGNFDSLVAGFVETGESLEEAVHREVMEETGLTIKNLKYFGSQPWPFPCGLMVGYTAEYVDGEIHLQKEELSRGKWFSKDNLPVLPEKLSIARKLIDAWLENRI